MNSPLRYPRYPKRADADRIKKALTDAFPGTRFSVNPKKSFRALWMLINYKDGPSLEAVNDVLRTFGSTFEEEQTFSGTHMRENGVEVRVDRHVAYIFEGFAAFAVINRRLKVTE